MSAVRPPADIVVLNYDGVGLLAQALPSIKTQIGPADTLTVFDNGSRDGSVDYVRATWPDVRVLAVSANVGVTAALNRAAASATAPYVALLNNDLELAPGWLDALVSALESHPEAASATGKLLNFFQRDILDGAGDTMSWAGRCLRRGRGERDTGQYDSVETVFSASGAAAVYRRSAFAIVGPFDEDFYAYLEDVDWGFRAQLAGFTCVYTPSAVAYHIGGATTERNADEFLAHSLRNLIAVILKNYPASRLARHAHRLLVCQLAYFLISVRDGHAGGHASAWFDAVRALPTTLRKRRVIQSRRRVSPEYLDSLLLSDWGFDATRTSAHRFLRAVRRLLGPSGPDPARG